MYIVMPTLLGVESLVMRELKDLGFAAQDIIGKDGQVYLRVADDWTIVSQTVAKLNVNLSYCERIEVELISKQAQTFDELFDIVGAYPWEKIIAVGSSFIIAGGYSRKSKLFGIPACQSIIKKAIISRLIKVNNLPVGSKLEENPQIQELKFQFSFMDDVFSLRFDTTGDGLHKRGYRIKANIAPLKETLAASLIGLTRFEPFTDELLWDPFCGSGTILIEAARKAASIAPGMRRNFASERLRFFNKKDFDFERLQAEKKADFTPPDQPFFYGTDIDPDAIKVAKENARRAGVASFIRFEVADIRSLSVAYVKAETGFERINVITNPPYGERLLNEEEAHDLLKDISPIFFNDTGLIDWTKLFILSSDNNLETALKFEADKRRKLYNGMIPCQFYQYFRRKSKSVKPNREIHFR